MSSIDPRRLVYTAILAVVALAVTPTPGSAEEPAAEGFPIPVIQGTERFSELAGRAVETTGVVTQIRPDGAGFWLQDPAGDGDPASSDALFVRLAGAGSGIVPPAVGDRVRVAGTVREEASGAALPRTELAELAALEVLASGAPLPAPTALVDLPDVELADAEAFWEPLEGMRVSLASGVVVGPTEAWGELSVLAAADAVPGSGYHPESGHALVRSLPERGVGAVDYNPELIVLQTLWGRAPQVRTGDRLVDVTGVVDPVHGTYKVWLDRFRAEARELPTVPVSRRSGDAGDVRVVSYNLRDLIDLFDHPEHPEEGYAPTPEELDVRLDKLALSIVHELALPQVIVGNELENAAILQAVGDRVNELAGTRYRAASLDTSDPRGLEVGFLYDEARADLLAYEPMRGPDVDEAFASDAGRFLPGRQPLVGTFRFADDGPALTVVANKFKTKRLEDPRLSTHETPVRHTEAQRKLQARVVRERVDAWLAADPEALILVTGDLGDFQFAEPGEGEDHPIGILEGLGDRVRMTNLIGLEDPGEAFTYVFQGNSMAMTHMLVSPALLDRLAGADVLHFNAGFPDRLKEDRSTPLRASDRDPVEGRFHWPEAAE